MNEQDLLNMVRQQMGGMQQSVLSRQPTVEEVDKFIDKCCNDRDETLYSLAQALIFKLERCVHSIPEGEIYPMVIARIQQRLEEGDK